MTDWGEVESKRVGCSLATSIRNRKTGEHAVDAWRRNYSPLEILFIEVPGFEDFMKTIASNTLRDSIYGMVFRVTVGAILSITDGVTDLYVITTYYENKALHAQANALVIMVSMSMFCQIVVGMMTHARKSWGVKLREVLITIFFLRPAVDAYRVSTTYVDEENTVNSLGEMVANKAFELACESIPGCVLQLYVWLTNPGQAGAYALVSIGISALTTGFTSAMISFDKDVDVVGRLAQPIFYVSCKRREAKRLYMMSANKLRAG